MIFDENMNGTGMAWKDMNGSNETGAASPEQTQVVRDQSEVKVSMTFGASSN